MLIYNNKKEFIGIDESDLEALGFIDLASLQAESADFGDLFVKTPGHLHNFKHVHWIDMALAADNKESAKAIIHANNKNFFCLIDVKTIYLTTSPATKSYIITLNTLRVLSSNENNNIAGELQTRVAPTAAVHTPVIEKINESQEEEIQVAIIQDKEDKVTPNDVVNEVIDDPYAKEDDLPIDIYEPTEAELALVGDAEVEEFYKEEVTTPEKSLIEETESIVEVETQEEPTTDNLSESNLSEDLHDYIFDVKKTAEILDMPVSNIEDFVNDFIVQSKDFKSKLYDSVADDDIITLKSLSHQLKGVAANLRIHDAEDILVQINKAKDFTTSKIDLDTFYMIIAKLSGEDITTNAQDNTVEDFAIEIEEEPMQINIDDTDDDKLEIIMDDDDDEDKLEIAIDDFDILDTEQDELLEIQSDTLQEEIVSYNKQSIANEIGLSREGFNELFDDYKSESLSLVDSIQSSIQENKTSHWKNSAIKLKGMSDNMRINNFISELEILITTQSAEDASDALKQLQINLSQILETKD